MFAATHDTQSGYLPRFLGRAGLVLPRFSVRVGHPEPRSDWLCRRSTREARLGSDGEEMYQYGSVGVLRHVSAMEDYALVHPVDYQLIAMCVGSVWITRAERSEVGWSEQVLPI
jgi:hypothetical protein